MKIVFLARYLPQEGSTVHMYQLSKALIQRGHEVHLISSGPIKEDLSAIKIFNESVEFGLKHHEVGFPNVPNAVNLSKIKLLTMYLSAIPKSLLLLRKINPDVVHVHYPVTSYIAKLYQLFTKRKFITTHHTLNIPIHPLHKKANYAIAISQELKAELIKIFNYKDEQVELIFNGVSKEKFAQEIDDEQRSSIKKELAIPFDVPIIGFVGSLNHRKGIDILLKACPLINKNFHIVLLGDGDKDWINSLVNEYNLQGKISIFPFQNPINFYAIFDLFVLPSRVEGFPLVPLEAMMMGVPVIRSNVGGATNQIKVGYNGYIFENEDSQELAKYINLLINDETLNINMGNNAKKLAIDQFTEEKMVDKIIHLYEKALNQ